MKDRISIVVTSISGPNEALLRLSQGCCENGYQFILIGDESSPAEFQLPGCDFYSLEKQMETGLKFAQLCPTRHYARKNIGYLLAMRKGSSIIVETDDDNIPGVKFWDRRQRIQKAAIIENRGWVNIYRYFTDTHIWPRGFPLEHLKEEIPPFETLKQTECDCPIQQGLVDDNPDVDAIYRLILRLPQSFKKDVQIALTEGSWCPFNSQNTTWWMDVFELLYLPAHCSFRMTDIWRSFIAQRIVCLNGWSVLFHGPTMIQQRNVHNPMHDFKDEIPGYLHNDEIRKALETLPLKAGVEKISDNLRLCYEKLVSMSLIGQKELALLDAWLEDIRAIRRSGCQ